MGIFHQGSILKPPPCATGIMSRSGGRQYAAFMFVTCYLFLFQLELLAREISNGTNGIMDGASAFDTFAGDEILGAEHADVVPPLHYIVVAPCTKAWCPQRPKDT